MKINSLRRGEITEKTSVKKKTINYLQSRKLFSIESIIVV